MTTDAASIPALTLRRCRLSHPAAPALSAIGIHVAMTVSLAGSVFTSDSEEGAICLAGARIDRQLTCTAASVTNTAGPALTAGSIAPVNNRDAWLTLLRDATPVYAAQPYQQLATAFRAQGHDSDIRAVLMAQRRDQLLRGALTRPTDRWWAGLTGALLGYGYQPWRALPSFTAVLVLSIVLALTLGSEPDPSPHSPCTGVEMIGTGVDLNTPFLPSMRSDDGGCAIISTTTPGAVLSISRWFLQLAAWALAALFIAGFTGIVRKR